MKIEFDERTGGYIGTITHHNGRTEWRGRDRMGLIESALDEIYENTTN